MKHSEMIRETKHKLFERGWAQRAQEDMDGTVCVVGAAKLAVYGEISHVYTETITCGTIVMQQTMVRGHQMPRGLRPIIEEAIGGAKIERWNDREGRTFTEVVDALDRAEKIAEQREAVA